jgi:hypothetical protein
VGEDPRRGTIRRGDELFFLIYSLAFLNRRVFFSDSGDAGGEQKKNVRVIVPFRRHPLGNIIELTWEKKSLFSEHHPECIPWGHRKHG